MLFNIIFAFVSIVLLCTVFILTLTAGSNPTLIDEISHIEGVSIPKRVLGGFFLIGIIGMVVCAVYGMLWWMPESWGSYSSEDNEWSTYRLSISSLLGLFGGIGLYCLIIEYARMKLKEKETQK